MTGRPSRVALWVTMLSGVMGIPARGDDGMCSLFGGAGAVAWGFGLLTGPRRFARAVIRIEGSAFGFVAICC
jgi:sugar (pentulose or hexulose) kinase